MLENFLNDFQYIIWIENIFNPIRVINRANSWAIWTHVQTMILIISERFAIKYPITPEGGRTQAV